MVTSVMTPTNLTLWVLLAVGCNAQLSQTATATATSLSASASASATITIPSTLSIITSSVSASSQPTSTDTGNPFDLVPSLLCASSPIGAASLLPNATIPAVPVTTGFSQADLDSLWNVVEAELPVSRPAITTVVQPLPNFTTGPDPPPFRPTFVQYSTQNLTLPKGFKYGVAGAAQQVEGAVKDGGRGPR